MSFFTYLWYMRKRNLLWFQVFIFMIVASVTWLAHNQVLGPLVFVLGILGCLGTWLSSLNYHLNVVNKEALKPKIKITWE